MRLRPFSARIPAALGAALMLGSALAAPALEPELARFVHEKEAQARELAEAQTNPVPSTVWSFFDAVRVDDWQTATNLFRQLQAASSRFEPADTNTYKAALATPLWTALVETEGTYELFHEWDVRWLRRFSTDVIASIPRNSLYFGGTDPGRFGVSAFSESQRDGNPFFTITQNQLADQTYHEYLRGIYCKKLQLLSTNDYANIYGAYLTNAVERMKNGQLKPGENIRMINGRPQVFGQVGIMELNGYLVQAILDRNPNREVYYEESFPLDRFYDRLEPHGLIFKLNHQPLPGLDTPIIETDRAFWRKLTAELIGDWLDEKTSVQQVCDFADNVHWRKDLTAFKGDKRFIGSQNACYTYAKLRSSIAGLYLWRAERARDTDERQRLLKEASFASRQAFALWPAAPEIANVCFRVCYALNRKEDAVRMADTALRVCPEDFPYRDWFRQSVKALHADE